MNELKLKLVSISSFLSGFSLFICFVATQANIISKLQPFNMVIAICASAIIFSFIVKFSHFRKLKFCYFIAFFYLVTAIAIFIFLKLDNYYSPIFLFFCAELILLFNGWAFHELIAKIFNPYTIQDGTSAVGIFYELGQIFAGFLILFYLSKYDFNSLIIYGIVAIIITSLTIFLGFSNRRLIEFNFGRERKKFSFKKNPHRNAIFVLFGLIAALFSINSFVADYLLAITVKAYYNEFEDIVFIATILLLVVSSLRLFLNFILGYLSSKVHLSPIFMLYIGSLTPLILIIYTLSNPSSDMIFLIYIATIVVTDTLFWPAENNISSFFAIENREDLKAIAISCFYLITSMLVILSIIIFINIDIQILAANLKLVYFVTATI